MARPRNGRAAGAAIPSVLRRDRRIRSRCSRTGAASQHSNPQENYPTTRSLCCAADRVAGNQFRVRISLGLRIR